MKTFKSFLLLGATVVASYLTTACICTKAGCRIQEGVLVELDGAAAAWAGMGPLTMKVCAEDTCETFAIVEQGGKLTCTPDAVGYECLGDTNLDISLHAEVPGATADVTVTVTNEAGDVLFDDEQTVKVGESYPNGEACGEACRTGNATFEVVAASG